MTIHINKACALILVCCCFLASYAEESKSTAEAVNLLIKEGKIALWNNDGLRLYEPPAGSSHAEWFPSGSFKIIGSYLDGKREGFWLTWGDSGQLQGLEHYKNGNLDGLCTAFYDSGNKMLEGKYVGGLPDGDWTFWQGEAGPAHISNFSDGTGTFQTWDPKGDILEEGKFEHGKKEGFWKLYLNKGIVGMEVNYHAGVIIGEIKSYDKKGVLIKKLTKKSLDSPEQPAGIEKVSPSPVSP